MSRRGLQWTAVAVAVLAVVAGGWWVWREEQRAETTARAQAAQAAAEEREQAREERLERLREESGALMPEVLEGLYLGMPLSEARRLRPAMAPNPTAEDPAEPHLTVLGERLENGGRAVYAFERESQRLQRVQILSLLPDVRAIAPHLTAMNERYGSPTGVWNCPNTGGVPTRRFTWRHGNTTVSDVFLVYGGRVSVTLYVAPTPVIGLSLRRAGCRPVQSRDELERFPQASPDQLRDEP
jgi:hypothetical protein